MAFMSQPAHQPASWVPGLRPASWRPGCALPGRPLITPQVLFPVYEMIMKAPVFQGDGEMTPCALPRPARWGLQAPLIRPPALRSPRSPSPQAPRQPRCPAVPPPAPACSPARGRGTCPVPGTPPPDACPLAVSPKQLTFFFQGGNPKNMIHLVLQVEVEAVERNPTLPSEFIYLRETMATRFSPHCLPLLLDCKISLPHRVHVGVSASTWGTGGVGPELQRDVHIAAPALKATSRLAA